MGYSEQVIDQVQAANDIVEVISAHLPLKRVGRNLKACCPFHQEKTPSFMVNSEKQIFHCFGCGVGGDVFSFLMKYDQMNFPEAVRHLAEQANITLPDINRGGEPNRSEKERLLQICSVARDFYHANLLHPQRGSKAREYLASRGFGESEIKAFGLGLALNEWRTLLQVLTKKGFREPELLRSGLITRGGQGSVYDQFRGRIMFPILNAQGKPIAFGGRVMGDEMPKYLNSPETPVFSKRRELYALHLAKRAVSASGDVRRILVTEGYLDCIRLHTNGFDSAVATLGTALTNDHARILKRYADEAIVVFDGDQAGEKAALRSADVFFEEGMGIKILSLPQGFDADDFIRVKGKEEMGKLVSGALDVFDFKLQVLLGRYSKTDSLGLLKITSEFLDTFMRIKSPVLVDRYLKRLALTLGVEEASLRSELAKLRDKHGKRQSRSTPAVQEKPPLKKASGGALEKALLSLFLNYPPYVPVFREQFPEFQFASRESSEVIALLETALRELGDKVSLSKLMNRIQDAELKTYISDVLVLEWSSGEDREQAFQDCLNAVRRTERAAHLRALRNQITQAEAAGDEDLVLRYMKDYQAILEKAEK